MKILARDLLGIGFMQILARATAWAAPAVGGTLARATARVAPTMGVMLVANMLGAQPGCTDPQAMNFDPSATENDGSCQYTTTLYTPPLIAQLPVDLEECSGLAFFENQLWTHLDGGNLDRIFTLDTMTAEKLETITIPNADNLDWEDFAEDDTHLYIGDFGNNSGDRTDLRIYKIKKSDLLAGTISPELIEFSYADQTVFTPMLNANDFDCEAFFFWEDSLHLFSKDWVDFQTRHYVLPTTPGTYVAELRGSLNVQGQITAADISEEGTAVLLGYNVSTSETFMYLLFEFQGSDFFTGNKRKISMGSAIGTSQPEGIVFRDLTRGYICSERFSVLPQKLLAFDVEQWIENPVSSVEEFKVKSEFSIYPNPTAKSININVEELNFGGKFQLYITNEFGQKVFEQSFEKISAHATLEIDVSHLRSGNYWVSISDEGQLLHARLSKF